MCGCCAGACAGAGVTAPTIFLAHEFFDALPIHHFALKDRGWCETLIDINDTPGSVCLYNHPRSLRGRDRVVVN